MTHALPSQTSSDGSFDAAGLQDLAARAVATSDSPARRGPFRPEVWLNARQRHTSRLAVYYFRAIDVLAVIGVTVLCAWMATATALIQATVGQVLPFAVGAVTVLGLMRSVGLYGFRRGEATVLHLGALSATVAAAGLVAVGLGLVLGHAGPALTASVVWAALVLLALYGLHFIWSDIVGRWRTSGVLTPNVVVVGATKHAERLIREALNRRDLNVLGVFDDRLARSPDAVQGVPVLGGVDDLVRHRITPYVDNIVLAVDPAAKGRIRELTERLAVLPNEVTLLVDPRGPEERTAALEKLAQAPLAALDGVIDDDKRAFNKRIQDLAIGSLALFLLAPVMLLTAIAIRLDSPGPIFFRQRRHGFNQEEVVVWKFRTMKVEATDATASRQVTADDDRVTRLGRILRSTSLDELPQLFNVLKGEMSLVGPRPHAIGMKTGQVESARLVAEYAHRHRIKPGMTGWAAVNGSRGPLHTAQDVRRRVQLDIDYIERQSLWMDLRIMAVTIPVILGDRLAVR